MSKFKCGPSLMMIDYLCNEETDEANLIYHYSEDNIPENVYTEKEGTIRYQDLNRIMNMLYNQLDDQYPGEFILRRNRFGNLTIMNTRKRDVIKDYLEMWS